MSSIFKIVLLSIVIAFNYTYGQDDSIKTGRLYTFGAVTAGAFIYGYGLQNNMWWKGEYSDFHTNWREDWQSSLGADKIGHFYFGYSLTNIYKHGLNWAGFSKEKSLLYSGLFIFTYQTFLEIRDGFSKDYGFSWGDFSANLMGSMYPLLQNKFDILQNFNFKISFQPSERFKQNSHSYITDDYESTYHWLTIDIDDLFPSVDHFIFRFFNVAIGHSVKGLDQSGNGKHEFFIGLDWDLRELPGNNKLFTFLKETLNLYHLPAPTIKIHPNIVWYGLKF